MLDSTFLPVHAKASSQANNEASNRHCRMHAAVWTCSWALSQGLRSPVLCKAKLFESVFDQALQGPGVYMSLGVHMV